MSEPQVARPPHRWTSATASVAGRAGGSRPKHRRIPEMPTPRATKHGQLTEGDAVFYQPAVAKYGYRYPMPGIAARIAGFTPTRVIIRFPHGETGRQIQIRVSPDNVSRR